eukprot:scaffold238318_cov29-Tisochrysis_lutea.AAC.1
MSASRWQLHAFPIFRISRLVQKKSWSVGEGRVRRCAKEPTSSGCRWASATSLRAGRRRRWARTWPLCGTARCARETSSTKCPVAAARPCGRGRVAAG